MPVRETDPTVHVFSVLTLTCTRCGVTIEAARDAAGDRALTGRIYTPCPG